MSKFNAGQASVLAISTVLVAAFVLLGNIVTTPVKATITYPVTICHHTPANNVTHVFQNAQSYFGHLGTPHSGQTYDTSGACPTPTATPVEACNSETSYTKDHDFEDSRVKIDYQDGDEKVVITPKAGYLLVSIGIDYTGSDANETNPSVGDGSSAVTYTAPYKDDDDDRESIDHVTVVVKKVCEQTVDVCPNIEGNQAEIPAGYHFETNSDENRVCVIDSNDETPAPEATPTPFVSPTCTGDTHLDAAGKNCVSFQYGGPQVQGASSNPQVLGASTMAGTGSFAETFYQAIMGLGGIFTAKGLKKFKKASKKA